MASSNKIREITEGAMMIAITGALILLDRIFSFFFEDVILLLIPIEIIIHFERYGKKSIWAFAFAFFVLIFLGNITTWIYLPLGVFVGIFMCLNAEQKSENILIRLIIIFTISEVLITLFLMPLLGISISSQLNGDIGKYSISSFIFMIVVIAFLESWLIIVLWRKIAKIFKTRIIEKINLFQFKITTIQKICIFLPIFLFPAFLYLEINNLYFILFSIWSFSYITFFILGFTKLAKLIVSKKLSIIVRLLILFTFPVSLPLLGLI